MATKVKGNFFYGWDVTVKEKKGENVIFKCTYIL